MLARSKLRLLRGWSALLALAAVGFLAVWRFTTGWLSSLGAVACLLCLVVLLLVVTVGGGTGDGFDGDGDGGGGGDGDGG